MKNELTISTPENGLVKADKNDSSREVIKEHLMAGGEGVELTEKQQELLERWECADKIIRENVGKLSRGEIANLLHKKFNVSVATAKMDMVNAEYVFSSSHPINKAHLIGLRIEFLQKQILKAANDKDHKSVASLEKVLEKYIANYPDLTPVEVPKNLIFSFDIEKLLPKTVDLDDAEAIIDKQIEKNRLMDSLSEDLDFDEEEGFEDE